MQHRGDFNSTSAVNCAAKTIVTITAPPAAAASASTLHLGSGNAGGRPSSVSTLTLASVPPSFLLEASQAGSSLKGGSVSAANTPIAPATKHTSFALGTSNPSTGSGHHVSFMPMPLPMMGVKRFRGSNASLGSPTAGPDVATCSAPSLIEAAESPVQVHHAALELRQSVLSQITTLEDVDDVERESEADGDGDGVGDGDGDGDEDSESDSVGLALVQTTPQLECQMDMASSSSSASVK